MLCLKKQLISSVVLTVLVLLVFFTSASIAMAANNSSLKFNELEVVAEDSGVYLTAQMDLQLSENVTVALYKGISATFVIEAKLLRKRWYWYPEENNHKMYYVKLSYQPLVDEWQLAVSKQANQSAGLLFTRQFDRFEQAINALQRIYRWKIADSKLDAEDNYEVQFDFYLDTKQLPRVMRIGGLWQQDWAISGQKIVPLVFNKQNDLDEES